MEPALFHKFKPKLARCAITSQILITVCECCPHAGGPHSNLCVVSVGPPAGAALWGTVVSTFPAVFTWLLGAPFSFCFVKNAFLRLCLTGGGGGARWDGLALILRNQDGVVLQWKKGSFILIATIVNKCILVSSSHVCIFLFLKSNFFSFDCNH